MNPSAPPTTVSAPNPRRFPLGILVPIGLALALYFLILGIISIFHVGSDLSALKSAVTRSPDDEWQKRVALNVGFVTSGLIHLGSQFVDLPPEARAAIDAVRAAEVGVYTLTRDVEEESSRAGLFVRADRAMLSRGWTRIVGVLERDNLVGVYVPRDVSSLRRMRCCVVVLAQRELVLVSAKANLEPLLKLAHKNLPAGSLGEIARLR